MPRSKMTRAERNINVDTADGQLTALNRLLLHYQVNDGAAKLEITGSTGRWTVELTELVGTRGGTHEHYISGEGATLPEAIRAAWVASE